jgi:hypothetical protein
VQMRRSHSICHFVAVSIGFYLHLFRGCRLYTDFIVKNPTVSNVDLLEKSLNDLNKRGTNLLP